MSAISNSSALLLPTTFFFLQHKHKGNKPLLVSWNKNISLESESIMKYNIKLPTGPSSRTPDPTVFNRDQKMKVPSRSVDNSDQFTFTHCIGERVMCLFTSFLCLLRIFMYFMYWGIFKYNLCNILDSILIFVPTIWGVFNYSSF